MGAATWGEWTGRMGLAAGIALLLAGPAAAQSVKPGLWEMTVVSKMAGEGLPPGMGEHTMKMNICITPEDARASWQELAASMQKETNGDCAATDFKQLGGGAYSFVTKCKSGMTGRVTGKITPESMQQSGDMVLAGGGKPMKMVVNNTSRWKAATCPPGTMGAGNRRSR